VVGSACAQTRGGLNGYSLLAKLIISVIPQIH
jgi:hypothetical protein